MKIDERHIKSSKTMTLDQLIGRIQRIQLKGRYADLGSAYAISGHLPSIRELNLI